MDFSKGKKIASDWLDDLETVTEAVAPYMNPKKALGVGLQGIQKVQEAMTPPERKFLDPNKPEDVLVASRTGRTVDEVNTEIGQTVQQAMDWATIGGMTAFHGTPHKIVGGFKKEAIGSGEGAQAFGHGFYATESKGIAKEYAGVFPEVFTQKADAVQIQKRTGATPLHANKIKNDLFKIKTYSGEGNELEAYYERLGEIINRKKDILNSKNARIKIKELGYSTPDEYFEVIKKLKSEPAYNLVSLDARPRIYTLDIPEPDVMLDWDKPFSAQNPAVKKALKESGVFKDYNANLSDFAAPKDTRGAEKRGQDLYAFLSNKLGGDVKASEYLNSLGIKGIRYKAGQISGAKSSASNYVIFEPSDIKITAEDFLDAI